jgi:hypothetical protein
MTALDVAQKLIRLPIRETHGKNRSPMIDQIVKRFGGSYGDPYCAYGVSYCFQEVYRQMVSSRRLPKDARQFPYTGSSQAIRRAFAKQGKLFTDPQRLLECKGAIGGWTNPDLLYGHVFGIGQRFTTPEGKVLAIGTWEFNTDLSSKDRDGEGAYVLKRSIEELRRKQPNFWFCDVSDLVGGSWWE